MQKPWAQVTIKRAVDSLDEGNWGRTQGSSFANDSWVRAVQGYQEGEMMEDDQAKKEADDTYLTRASLSPNSLVLTTWRNWMTACCFEQLR